MKILNIIFPKKRHIYYPDQINIFKIKEENENLLKQELIEQFKFDKKNTFFASSARALILTIFKSLKLKKDEYLILPNYSCSYLYKVAELFSNNIIFCGFNHDTTYIQTELFEIIKRNNVKAIFFSPLFGNDEDYEIIHKLKKKQIEIIYDHCQSINVKKKIIQLTDYDIYSFNFGKQINGTGGGVVNTNKKIDLKLFTIQKKSYILKRYIFFLIFSKYRRFFFLLSKFIERSKSIDNFIGLLFSRERSNISCYKIHKIDLFLVKNQISRVIDKNHILVNNYQILRDVFINNYSIVNQKNSLCTKYIIQTKNNFIKKKLCQQLRLSGIEYETLFKPHYLNNDVFFNRLYIDGIALPNNIYIDYKKIQPDLEKINQTLINE